MKTSDLLVTVLGVAGEGLAPVRALAAQRKAEGRPLQVITTTHVVCRETDREAEDYYQHYAVDNAEHEDFIHCIAAPIRGVRACSSTRAGTASDGGA